MKFLSRMFLLFLLFTFSSLTWGENTVVLGENGQVTEEKAETDGNKDAAKEKKEKKKGKKKGSGDEEPDCE